MTEAKSYPLSAWYAAAWSHEIKHELAARRICDKDVVLYRRSDGGWSRWRMRAGIACCRSRSAG